jgi:hypothetical protein
MRRCNGGCVRPCSTASKPNPRPTARRVFQSFIDISVLHVSSLKTFVVGLTAAQKALLTLLGDRYVALYANSG